MRLLPHSRPDLTSRLLGAMQHRTRPPSDTPLSQALGATALAAVSCAKITWNRAVASTNLSTGVHVARFTTLVCLEKVLDPACSHGECSRTPVPPGEDTSPEGRLPRALVRGHALRVQGTAMLGPPRVDSVPRMSTRSRSVLCNVVPRQFTAFGHLRRTRVPWPRAREGHGESAPDAFLSLQPSPALDFGSTGPGEDVGCCEGRRAIRTESFFQSHLLQGVATEIVQGFVAPPRFSIDRIGFVHCSSLIDLPMDSFVLEFRMPVHVSATCHCTLGFGDTLRTPLHALASKGYPGHQAHWAGVGHARREAGESASETLEGSLAVSAEHYFGIFSGSYGPGPPCLLLLPALCSYFGHERRCPFL